MPSAQRDRFGPEPKPVAERFWPRVDTSGGPDACWPWKGCRHPNGYGRMGFGARDRTEYTHRVAFFLTHGHMPVVSRHRCDNPPCCNPAHIEDGSKADNSRDMVKRGHSLRGERHGNAKLSSEDVAAIRELRGEARQAELATRFGVSVTTVSQIQSRKRWA